MYPRRMALRRVVLEGEPRAQEMYVVKEASLRLVTGGEVGLMEKAVISGGSVGDGGEVSGGCAGRGGGCGVATHSHRLVWSRREQVSGLPVQRLKGWWG